MATKKTAAGFWARTMDIQIPSKDVPDSGESTSQPEMEGGSSSDLSLGSKPKRSLARMASAPSQLAELVLAETSAAAKLAQFEGAEPARRLDASRVRFSQFANRLEGHFRSAEFSDLLETIRAAGGNVQPGMVRPIFGDPDHDYEVVFGHRRLRAVQLAQVPFLALVREVSDIALLDAMSRENLARSNLSIYEWGLHYRNVLQAYKAQGADSGLPQTQRQLAQSYGIHESIVSTAMSAANLPEAVIQCLAAPEKLSQKDIQALARSRASDEEGLVARAELLQKKSPLSHAKTIEYLLAVMPASQPQSRSLETPAGTGRLWIERNQVRMQLPIDRMNPERFEQLGTLLQKWAEGT